MLNCSPVVADVRTLRAATFAPYVLGLTLFVMVFPLPYAFGNKRGATQFLGSFACTIRYRTADQTWFFDSYSRSRDESNRGC